MPVNYRYDAFTSRLTTRCEGTVNLTQVIEHFRQLGRDARLKPHCDVVLDLSFLESPPATEQLSEIATIIEDTTELVPFGRCAVIAHEDGMYGLGQMFQGFTWPLFTGIRVFRNNAEAAAWLDLEP